VANELGDVIALLDHMPNRFSPPQREEPFISVPIDVLPSMIPELFIGPCLALEQK
jgi:hypothetical protein